MPADAAVGLAPERKVEAGFGEREEQGEAVADAWLAWDAVAAFRALVIAKMISVQKLSMTPIRAGTSRSSHRGKLRRFMGAIVSALRGRPVCVALFRIFLRASG